ncbi:uncharacterized protein [Elaeis guineensis]|uniref:Uncharacterized protein At3g17950 isoform X2 n=1 Tax=Elaeis guineensis var. tenera TaxID=51953 RepID=A0A6I9SDJ4_ELAGV|nr:uncharacterized protein At3g17950 isoform X2 [Elaeis guineensis]
MAQQGGGWPLGLQPLNVRVGLIRNLDFSGSLSFTTLVSGSPSPSSITSSDLDTDSTASFFHDRSITLGSLIGITSIFELSRRSLKRSRKQDTTRGKNSQKNKTWFSFCIKARLKRVVAGNAPSLGHFLEVERRAGNAHRRDRGPLTYELDGLPEDQSNAEANSLLANGLIVPPQVDGNGALALVGDVKKSNSTRSLGHDDGCCLALMFPCMGGRSGH